MLMTLGEKTNDHVGGSTVKGKCHHPLLNPHKCSCWYFPSSFQVPTKLQAKLLFSLKCKQFCSNFENVDELSKQLSAIQIQ